MLEKSIPNAMLGSPCKGGWNSLPVIESLEQIKQRIRYACGCRSLERLKKLDVRLAAKPLARA